MRGLIDGHVWLSRRLAEKGHFPAIDVLRSISRLMNDVTTQEHRLSAQILRRMLAVLHENDDLLSIGAYRKGTNRDLDVAVAMKNEIHTLLRQAIDQRESLSDIHAQVQKLAQQCAVGLKGPAPAPQPAKPPVDRARFGIGSLLNRMTGSAVEGERMAPAQRIQPQVTAFDDEPDMTSDQERIEIPAFLRRQAN